MKIAFRISNMGFGGAERVFLSIAEELAHTYQAKIDFVVDEIAQGQTENLVLSHGFQLFSLASKRTLQSIIPLKDYINTQQPHIIISAYSETNIAAIISTKLARHQCKVIVTEHAPIKEHIQHSSIFRRFLLKIYIRFGYRFANHVMAVSKGIATEMIKMGLDAGSVSHIHNPVRFSPSTNNLHSKNHDKPIVLLAVGRIMKAKDYLTLLRAFNIVRINKDVRLVIVGGVHDAGEKNLLDNYVTENQLSELVDFVGFTEDVHTYYASADVFVLSSAWEGFGNVLVEALAFGLPIVSTNCNYGPSEILHGGQYGQLVPVGDWQEMAKALIKTISNKDNIDTDLLKSRSMAFSESSIAKQYWKLIQSITIHEPL